MTNEDIVTIIAAVIGSGAFVRLIDIFYNFIKSKKGKLSPLELGLRVLLEERINYLGRLYVAQGFIYADDKDRLERMWKIYHEVLKGNGYLDAIMQEVEKLEVKWR